MNNKWLDFHDKSCWIEIPKAPVFGYMTHRKIRLDDYIVAVSHYLPLDAKREETIGFELQFKTGEDPAKPSNSQIQEIYDVLYVPRGNNHPKWCQVKAPFKKSVKAKLVSIKFLKPVAQLVWEVKR